MFLYEKEKKKINIYSFEADKEALIEYRKKIMKEQDINKLFYSFETTNDTIMNRFLKADELDIRFLKCEDKTMDASGWWSELKLEKETSGFNKVIQEELIDKYINGDFSQTIPTSTFVCDEGIDCYLASYLVTGKPSSIYSNMEKRHYSRLENMICLPKKLCALQLLENGKFSQILGSWMKFEEPLQLFTASKIDSVSDEEMEKMFTYGLLSGTYDDTIRNVNTTQKIIKKIKK